MDNNEFFLNTALQHPPPTIVNWPSSSSMEIQPPPELNLGRNPTNDCFFWEKSTEQSIFDSALSSLVSSPSASNSNFSGGVGDSFIIRELIGKLGNIGNRSGEIYGTPLPSNGKVYATTPMSSPPPPPPKLNIPMMSTAKPTPLADFSGDPGFAERAARFSCFGSRSFNGRNTSPAFAAVNNCGNNIVNGSSAASTVGTNGNLPRVSSSPTLKALAAQMCNSNLSSPTKNCSNIVNEESTVPGQRIPGSDSCHKHSGEHSSRKRKSFPKGKSKENSPSSAALSHNSSKVAEGNEDPDPKRSKVSEENGNKEETAEGERGKGNKTKSTEPPKDYIHVRARRGQATDSHSLAERVRREKISERMKLLQDLVPGCNKVTGKALMLDEIINYVQSLQRQVEFLSMKLASVNTRLDFNVDALLSKDVLQQSNHPMHHHQPYYAHQPQQHNNANGTIPQYPLDPMDTSTLTRSFSTHLPLLTQFTDPTPQYPTFREDDLHSIVQMSFTQNSSIRESEPIQSQSQNFQGSGSNEASHMKIEI